MLPFSPHDPQLVMRWHLRPTARGRGIAGHIGHALAHQAFVDGEVDEIFVVSGSEEAANIAVATRIGMAEVHGRVWRHRGVRLSVLRMSRQDFHKIRPRVSMDNSYTIRTA